MTKLNGQTSILVHLLQLCERYFADADDNNYPPALRSHIQHELIRYKDTELDLEAIEEFHAEYKLQLDKALLEALDK